TPRGRFPGAAGWPSAVGFPCSGTPRCGPATSRREVPPMRWFLAIAQTGVVAILLHPLRSLVTVGCLVAILLPYLAGLGLAKGIEREAEVAVECGADLYVAGSQFGRNAPIPLAAADAIRKIPGVTEVVPRIVGPIVLGKDQEAAVLV